MAIELSSNWKKLQAQIKSESSSNPPAAKPTGKITGKPTGKSVTGKRTRGTEEEGNDGSKKQPPAKKSRQSSAPNRKPAPKPKTTVASTSAMGISQSSRIVQTAGSRLKNAEATAPSLALWAEEHDISPEDLAQAYGLGVVRGGGSTRAVPGAAAAALLAAAKDDRENAGLTAGLAVGKYVALDCEMVGVGDGGHDDALARVSLVDFFGRQIYDSYVQLQPGQTVTDWRTPVSGITRSKVRQGRMFEDVRATVASLLRGDDEKGTKGPSERGRILVGHDVRHDLRVLELSHPPRLIRDTAKFSGFKQYGHGPKPALRVLARTLLDVDIQQGAHSSVEDARVTMQLFRQHKSAFDMECANRFSDDTGPTTTIPIRKTYGRKKGRR